ncbi:MAG: right-handed parallel beta-helix repeat-containing protein, partial [Candidatus Omnitrophica bacterium]|nr:right-handed parallel beta-helix repeat-containing protein [Candidatus Omnitrophota bacterium]
LLAHSATLHVSPEGSGTDGLSWETAYPTITEAVIASTTGDSIWVKAGVYEEAVEVTKEISLYGGFAGTESLLEFSLRNILENLVEIDARSLEKSAISIRNVTGAVIDGLTLKGLEGEGGGISVIDASPYITSCIIRDSYSFAGGGGINFRRSSGVVENCVITENFSDDVGGGIASFEGSEPTLRNCIIASNDAPFAGGVCVALNERGIHLVNCLVRDNHGNSVVGGICASIGFVNVVNSIIRGNLPSNLFAENDGGEILVTYSNIQGGWPGEGNIDADPLFMDSENGDFRLQENSPCIDTASTEGPLTDIDGNPRPIDLPGVGRDGTGDEFDMGPYERVPSGSPIPTSTFTSTVTPTPTFTLTPTVTPTPTLTLTPSPTYPTDINQDGVVNAEDLVILLEDWGRVSGAR